MHSARTLFDSNVAAARELDALYTYLVANVVAPLSYDDLLRSQVVYAVSAFDKLIHDLVPQAKTLEGFLQRRSAPEALILGIAAEVSYPAQPY